jgi:hypothetical protein
MIHCPLVAVLSLRALGWTGARVIIGHWTDSPPTNPNLKISFHQQQQHWFRERERKKDSVEEDKYRSGCVGKYTAYPAFQGACRNRVVCVWNASTSRQSLASFAFRKSVSLCELRELAIIQ